MVLTIVHMWENYKGVGVLSLRSLNWERGELVLEDFVRSGVETVRQQRQRGGGGVE